MTLQRWQSESFILFQGSGVNDSINSASGVTVRKFSNELKDLAAVAETQQDVLHMVDWSDEEL